MSRKGVRRFVGDEARNESFDTLTGAEREAGQLAYPCILKLWEAQGPRTVTLGNITFPAVEQGTARE